MAKAFPLRTCDALIGITQLFRPLSIPRNRRDFFVRILRFSDLER